MDKIREIAGRGFWSSGVYDHHPKIGPRIIRISGKYPSEGAAVERAKAAIADGRPDIETFIHRESARPSVHFNLTPNDIDEIGRALT